MAIEDNVSYDNCYVDTRVTHYLRGVDAVEQFQYLLHDTRSLSGAAKADALRSEGSAVRLHDQLELLVFMLVSFEIFLCG